MTEYIEREALVRQIICNIAEFVGAPDEVQRHDEYCNYAINIIEDAPSADVAQVVRCKDCKYFGLNDENVPYCLNPFGLDDPEPNGFCNYGIGKN